MAGERHCRRVDTIELKFQIEKRLGRQKTQQYFNLLNSYFSLKISKSDFDRLCIRLLGRESITLHNRLIRAVIRNAHVSKSPPPKYGKGKPSLNMEKGNLHWNCKSTASPVWIRGKPHRAPSEDSLLKVQEQQSATELLSLGSRPPVEVTSVEEGEEIEQLAESPGIHSRSPLRAPFGVSLNVKAKRGMLSHGSSHSVVETCYKNGELPDTSSLRKRLEQKLEMGGLNVSTDCANLLNNGLDTFIKRLLKPCVDLASSRSESKFRDRVHTKVKSSTRLFPVSITDFRVATESNPQILGEDWPLLMEKMCPAEEYWSV